MRYSHGNLFGFALLALAILTPFAAAADSDHPLPYRQNAALPSPDDLIVFDDTAAIPPARLDLTGANQRAFPIYYGTTPPTTAPGTTVANASRDNPLLNPMPPAGDDVFEQIRPKNATAPTQTPVTGEPTATLVSSAPVDTGFVDYQSYVHQSTVPSVPAAIAQTPAASQAPADPTSPTVGLAEFKSGNALDGTPLPPPPLPELPATHPEPVLPPPDVSLVRSEFTRLKAFCEEDSLGSAAEVYSAMPDFGKNEEVNRLRADAANLLILGLSRTDNLGAARRIYESVPTQMPGEDAMLAKARGVINLATYYVRAERYNDAYEVLMDIGKISNRSALNNELFRLMARMIPYLDNAEETEKATAVYDLLFTEIQSPGTAILFAENLQGVVKYYLHYVDKTESPIRRRKRLDFLEHAFAGLEKPAAENVDLRRLRKTIGNALAERYSGDPDRAAKFYTED